MADYSIAIKIAGELASSFKSALKGAQSGLSGMAGMAGKLGSVAMKGAAIGIDAASTAAVGLGTAAVNVGKEFEGAMSQVAATKLLDTSTKKGQAQFQALEDAARECGATTAFSATEAAQALNNLAMAGYDTDKSVAALPTTLNLAGAGALSLEQSASILTAGMASLGIEQTEQGFSHFADILAITASKAKTDVAGIGEAITTVGKTAANLKGGTEEVAASLGILADVDLTGSEGGTHLRNMIMSLQNPRNKNAAEMFENLGLSAYDSQGKMRGLNEIFGDLSKSMAGMTDQKKNNILSTIFKQTDIAAASAMLENCGDRFDELYDAAKNSSEGMGASAEMYAKQMDNLDGDIDILKSSLSDLGISFYKDAGGPLRSVTQAASGMVTQLNNAYKSGGLSAMLVEVGNSMAQIVSGAAKYAPMAVNVGIDLIQNLLNGITQNSGGIASAAGNVLTTFANGIFTLAPQIAFAGIDIIVQLADSLTAQAPQLLSSGTQAIANFVSGLIQQGPNVANAALSLIQSLITGIVSNAPALLILAVQLIGSLATGIGQMLPQVVQMGVQLILGLAQGLVSSLPAILQIGPQAIVNLVNGLTQALPMLVQGGFQLITMLVQGIAQNLPAIAQAAVTIIMSLVSGLASAIPQLWEAAKSLPGAIWDAFCSVDWLSVGAELITSIGTGIIDGLKSIGGSVVNTIKGWFGGGDDSGAASESAASTVSSYASGIEANAGAVTGAASSLSTTAFSGMDFTAATTAGTQSADAFSTGLNGGMMDLCTDTSGISLDNAALTASFGQAGTEGAGAFSTGLADGLSGLSVDTSSISLDNAALTADLGQAGADGAAVLGENLNAGLASASADTSAQMAQITAAVQDNMSQADSTVQQKMAAMVSRIQSGGSQMVQAATSAVQGIKSAFGGIDLSQSGTSMMQGLVNGISSMRGQVEAAARNVAQTAADSVNRALQIHSPSRLMIKSGQFIDEGLAGGMIKNAGKVKSAAVAAMAQPVMDTGKGMQGFSAIQSIMDMQGRKNRVRSALDGVVSSSSVINKINNSTVDNSSQSSPAFVFSPTYQINGNASREDIVQAGNISQAEFDKRMKEFMRKNGRVQFV